MRKINIRTLTAGSIAFGEVSTLDHKIFDDTMKFRAFVTFAFLEKRPIHHALDKSSLKW